MGGLQIGGSWRGDAKEVLREVFLEKQWGCRSRSWG